MNHVKLIMAVLTDMITELQKIITKRLQKYIYTVLQ